jgi:hypothetical protein
MDTDSLTADSFTPDPDLVTLAEDSHTEDPDTEDSADIWAVVIWAVVAGELSNASFLPGLSLSGSGLDSRSGEYGFDHWRSAEAGSFEVKQPISLKDAISLANGFTPYANARAVEITHNDTTRIVDFTEMLKGNVPMDQVERGDTVRVPVLARSGR